GPLLQSCSDQERTLLSALTAMGPTSIPFAAVEAVLRRLDGGALEREGSADPTSTMERLSALALVTLSSKKGLTVEDPVRRLGHNDHCGLSVAPARRLAMVGLFHTLPSNVRVRLTPNLATLITHARHLLTTVDCDEAAFLIQRIGAFDALIGDHDSEKCCFRSSYEWFKAQHGEAHVDTLEALYELSLCYQNRTLEAEEAQIVEEALTKALTTVGEHSITTIKLLQRKAIMLGDTRHLNAALEHINQAESNALKLLGYNDRMTLMIQNSKALFLKAKGRIG